MEHRSTLKDRVRQKLPPSLLYRIRLLNAIWRASKETKKAGKFTAAPHSLGKPLLISLTSFPARFQTLHLTLESLLNQTVIPDAIVLWIAHEDIGSLPDGIRALQSERIQIRACSNLHSYKKLVFALDEFPDCFIATADDDLYYRPTWLEILVSGLEPGKRVIACHRAHRIKVGEAGHIAPYGSWEWDVADERARMPSRDIVPTTGAGALYPPGCFVAEVTDSTLFERLSPTADDLWFYWMACLARSQFKKVGDSQPLIMWPAALRSSLWKLNQSGGNDVQIRSLEQMFGNPLNA